MSTNYYIQLPDTQSPLALALMQALTLIQSFPIQNQQTENILTSGLKALKLAGPRLHVGKKSAGYRFLFDSNYYSTIQSWREILNTCQDRIVDDSNNPVSLANLQTLMEKDGSFIEDDDHYLSDDFYWFSRTQAEWT